jgi:hypothetical protein
VTLNASEKTAKFDDRKQLSTLWTLVMFNMVFADVIGFMNPGALDAIMKGDTPAQTGSLNAVSLGAPEATS